MKYRIPRETQKLLLSYAAALLALALSLFAWSRLAGADPVTTPLTTSLAGDRSIVAAFDIAILPPEAVEEVKAAAPEAPAAVSEPPVTETPEPQPEPVEENELEQWEIGYAYTISIPSLDLRAPVLVPSRTYWDERAWDLLEEQMQTGLAYGAVAYPHSASPGARGTLFISGHSSPPDDRAGASRYARLFARLEELTEGDIVHVTRMGESFTYRVTGKKVVPASETEILRGQAGEALLSLITCYPVGTTKDRLVVTAELL